jgi:hypothetical protein
MKITVRALVLFFFAVTLGAVSFWGTEAQAEPTFFTSQGCSGCHVAPAVATCNGCHHHGYSSLKAVTNKTSYAPGETVTATLSGGSKSGWMRVVLYDQNNTQVAKSSGNASDMGSSTTFPATLTAPAPMTPGTYTWKMAWYGNQFDSGGTYGAGWTPDPTNPNHGEERVSTNSFTVTAASVTTPTVSSVTPASLVQGAVNQTVTIAGNNLTGATVTFSNAGVTHGAATVTATSISLPVSVTAAAATEAGNVTVTTASGSASSTFTITAASGTGTTRPTLTISALADGAYTNKATLNISGNASDAVGIKSVTVNGRAVVVNTAGAFSTALTLRVGANTVTVIATDKASNQQTDIRTITYDRTAPVLTVSAPADNSSSVQSFITLTGTISENSTVTVTDNNGTPQNASINGTSFSATVNLTPEVNTILIKATDLAGNTTSAKRTVTYDSGAMTLAVTNPNQDITTSKSSLVLTGTIADALSRVTVRITMNGRVIASPAVIKGAFSTRLTFTQYRTYAITVTARDAAGISRTATRNVIYRKAGDDGGQTDD